MCENMDDKKRKRSPNFSHSEIDLLCELVVKYSAVIESKQSDVLTWEEKIKCWNKLTSEFNNKTSGLPRTMATLRAKYDSFKKELRKKNAKYKQELYKTGGGTIETPSLTPNEEKIYSLIALSVDGLAPRFDDDVNNNIHNEDNNGNSSSCIEQSLLTVENEEFDFTENISSTPSRDNSEIILIEVQDDTLHVSESENKQSEIDQSSKSETWKNWSSRSLKAPNAKCLQVNKKKHLLTKLQASQKVNTLAECKKELVNLQIQYLKKNMETEEKCALLRIGKAEEDLRIAQVELEIKELEKKIKEEAFKKMLQKSSGLDFSI